MNYHEALTKLWAWQHWYRTTDREGRHYGVSFLRKGFDSAPKSLHSDSRDTVRRLNLLGKCMNCGAVVSPNSTGDHIIPLAKGGPQSSVNLEPLCRSCNSSKGDKDLLEWWIEGEQKTIDMLNVDALCIYLRFMYQMLERQNMLQEEVPDYCEAAVLQAAMTMQPDMKEYFESSAN
jgi:hypothetical protein